jgi:hypothetical protein
MAYRKILVYRCKEYINGRRAGASLLPHIFYCVIGFYCRLYFENIDLGSMVFYDFYKIIRLQPHRRRVVIRVYADDT